MDVIINNLWWMAFNVALATVALAFAQLVIKTPNKILKALFLGLFVVFIPNSIYLLTDLKYLPLQMRKFDIIFDVILILQYIGLAIIGMVSYVYALNPIVKFLKVRDEVISGFNFVVAFGVALGRFERTQSWHVISDPLRVLNDAQNIINNQSHLLFVVAFGVLINIVWWKWKKGTR